MDEFRAEAEALLRVRRFGILSTHSEAAPGYPFGSLASYAVDDQGRPVFLFSGLALHTQNAAADPRVSLTVFDAAAEERPQTAPRVTVIGDLAPVPQDEDAAARALYLERHPEAKELQPIRGLRSLPLHRPRYLFRRRLRPRRLGLPRGVTAADRRLRPCLNAGLPLTA